MSCRSFARQVSALKDHDREFLLLALCGFSGGLAARLRGQDETSAIAKFMGAGDWTNAPNPTGCLLHQIGVRLLALVKAGEVNPIHYSVMEEQLHVLTHVQAGCERILLTPVPFSYSLLLHRTAYIFCLALPFVLAGSLGWWTLLPVLLIAYSLFGLDALSSELEDPFGMEANDLPLGTMVRTVEREMLSLLGRKDLPPVIEPVNFILS